MPRDDQAFPSPRRRRAAAGGGGGDFVATFPAEPDARALSLDTAVWKEVFISLSLSPFLSPSLFLTLSLPPLLPPSLSLSRPLSPSPPLPSRSLSLSGEGQREERRVGREENEGRRREIYI